MRELEGKKKEENGDFAVEQNAQFAESRLNFLAGFIGKNRTGKSATAEILANKWRENNPDGHICSFDPQSRFREISDSFLHAGMSDQELRDATLTIYDGLLILDDYKIIHEKQQAQSWLLQTLHFRNDHNLDIIYITHSPSLIVNALTFYTTHYFIFFTETRTGDWAKKIPNYQICKFATKFVNKYVRENGRGEYPKFPHLIVETETERLISQNMNPDKMSTVEEERV